MTKHIVDPVPKGARCAERNCHKKAKRVRLTNEVILMRDGTIHEGVEYVCEEHADG
jgi:hypothetical protein